MGLATEYGGCSAATLTITEAKCKRISQGVLFEAAVWEQLRLPVCIIKLLIKDCRRFIEFVPRLLFVFKPFIKKNNKPLEAVLYGDVSAAGKALCVVLITPLICSEMAVKLGLKWLVTMQTCDLRTGNALTAVLLQSRGQL